MNEDYVKVARLSELSEGTPVDVEVDGQVLVLVNVEGDVYAVSAWCSHLGTSLALGTMDGHTLMCWAHLWRYDVRTGEPIWPPLAKIAPCYRLRVYPTKVEGDDVYVSRMPRRGGLI